MATITGKDLRKQLQADLIGKDSYRGITLTYAWLANQFGHIGLGFIPTIILYKFLAKHHAHANTTAAIIIGASWTLFETYNFLGPLLSKRHTESGVAFVPGSKYIFQPDWKNIAFDTLTDVLFFWLGACLAGLLSQFSVYLLVAAILLILILIKPIIYWYKTKMYLQTPGYPFQFRLSQWKFLNLDEESKREIMAFLNNTNKGRHLFIFGKEGSGKTSLSVALATELSIKHHACLYTTGIKLYPMFYKSEAGLQSANAIWTWRTARTLVIDDINAGAGIPDIMTSDMFYQLVNNEWSNENKSAFKNVNIIWVLGNKQESKPLLDDWKEMLKRMGVNEKNIASVNLL